MILATIDYTSSSEEEVFSQEDIADNEENIMICPNVYDACGKVVNLSANKKEKKQQIGKCFSIHARDHPVFVP